MSLGESLKRFRLEYGLKQNEIAAKLNIFPQVYQKYESDQTVPSAKVLINIAEKYNVSLDYLVGFTDNPAVKTNNAETEFTQAVMECSKILVNALNKRGIKNVYLLDNQQN